MIRSLGELSGLDLVAKIGIEKDRDKPEDTGRNVIKAAIGPDHADYLRLMGAMPTPSLLAPAPGYAAGRVVDNPHAGAATPAGGAAPFWAR